MASDTETSVLEARRVDTRVDTGTIRRIVCGGDSDTEVWYTDGDAPLDALQAKQSAEALEGVLRGETASHLAATVIVTGSERYWDGQDRIIRHRRRRERGVGLIRVGLRAHMAMVAVLGGFLVWVTSKASWLAVPGLVKRAASRVGAWLRARKWEIMRQRARYRAAGRRTDWGFTIRRQIAVRASKVSFAMTAVLGLWWIIAIAVLFVLGQFSFALVGAGIGTTCLFLGAGFVFDTVAERADLHRYDMVIKRLPNGSEATRKPGWGDGAGFWATQTATDLDMPRPVHLRAHERAEAGAMPIRPAAPERRTLAATRVDWVPEAGAWF